MSAWNAVLAQVFGSCPWGIARFPPSAFPHGRWNCGQTWWMTSTSNTPPRSGFTPALPDNGIQRTTRCRALATNTSNRDADPVSSIELRDSGSGETLTLRVKHNAYGGVQTGGHVWVASRLLARWLFERPAEVAGQTVLELGCGLALPSLLAARLCAAKVVASDSLADLTGDHLAANAALNGVDRVQGLTLDLGSQSDVQAASPGSWDLVLFADVVYSGEVGEKLPHALALLLSSRPGASAIGAFPKHIERTGVRAFWRQVAAIRLEWEPVHLNGHEEGATKADIAAVLFRFRVGEKTVRGTRRTRRMRRRHALARAPRRLVLPLATSPELWTTRPACAARTAAVELPCFLRRPSRARLTSRFPSLPFTGALGRLGRPRRRRARYGARARPALRWHGCRGGFDGDAGGAGCGPSGGARWRWLGASLVQGSKPVGRLVRRGRHVRRHEYESYGGCARVPADPPHRRVVRRRGATRTERWPRANAESGTLRGPGGRARRYTASMSITFLNKWLLSGQEFGYPFLLNTMNNFLVCFIALLLTRIESLRPPALPPRLVATVVVPIGALTALDIGFSNLALMRMAVSLHTIMRGTTPAFVLLFAIAFGLQPFSTPLCCSVLTVVLGGCLAALPSGSAIEGEQVDFDPLTGAPTEDAMLTDAGSERLGLIFVVLSCIFSGLRWVLTQMLLSHTIAGTALHSGPLSSVYYISPSCAFGSLVGALVSEREAFSAPLLQSVELLLPVAAIACGVFVLLMCEYALVSLTSSLSLSVLGVLKELTTILVASLYLGDELSAFSLLGFTVVACGVLVYHVVQWHDDQDDFEGKGEAINDDDEHVAGSALGDDADDEHEGARDGAWLGSERISVVLNRASDAVRPSASLEAADGLLMHGEEAASVVALANLGARRSSPAPPTCTAPTAVAGGGSGAVGSVPAPPSVLGLAEHRRSPSTSDAGSINGSACSLAPPSALLLEESMGSAPPTPTRSIGRRSISLRSIGLSAEPGSPVMQRRGRHNTTEEVPSPSRRSFDFQLQRRSASWNPHEQQPSCAGGGGCMLGDADSRSLPSSPRRSDPRDPSRSAPTSPTGSPAMRRPPPKGSSLRPRALGSGAPAAAPPLL